MIKFFWTQWLCCVILLFIMSFAAAQPTSRAIHYKLTFHSFHIADVHDKLVFNADGTYDFTSITTPVGIASWLGLGQIKRTSRGLIDRNEGRLRTSEFTYSYKDETRRSIVDHETNIIATSNEGDIDMNLRPGSQFVDNLTLVYFLYIFPERAHTKLDVMYTDGKRAKLYELSPAGTDEITVPAGVIDAVRYDRITPDRVSSIWFDRVLNMLPVQVRISLEIGPVELLLVDANEIISVEEVALESLP